MSLIEHIHKTDLRFRPNCQHMATFKRASAAALSREWGISLMRTRGDHLVFEMHRGGKIEMPTWGRSYATFQVTPLYR